MKHVDDKPPEEVYRGHFEECVADLSRRLDKRHPKGSHHANQNRKKIAEFCGVGTQTVLRWLNGDNIPQSSVFIKLMCYLGLLGYRVIEVEKMKESRRNFFYLIGFGVITLEQASQKLGYSKSSNLTAVLQGKFDCDEVKKGLMYDTWVANKDALSERRRTASEQLGINLIEEDLPVPEPAKLSQKSSPKRFSLRVQAIVHIAKGLSVLLSEPFDASDLAALGVHTGDLLKLNARLSDLGSKLIQRSISDAEKANKK